MSIFITRFLLSNESQNGRVLYSHSFDLKKPGLELRYTPIQAPVGPLLSTASTKLKILNAKFEISAKNWVEWSL